MREPTTQLNKYRIRTGDFASDESWGMSGFFRIPYRGILLTVIASDGADEVEGEHWEHVSVSTANRPPTWEEMCFVKDLFWREDEMVIQYHPAKKDYINCHPYVLHMWRPLTTTIPMPPKVMMI